MQVVMFLMIHKSQLAEFFLLKHLSSFERKVEIEVIEVLSY